MNSRSREKSGPRGPLNALAQLRSVSHALVSTLWHHRSKTSKPIQFGSPHFRHNWGWPCTAVRMWLICSNRKLYHKKTMSLLPRHYTTILFVIDCLTTFTAQIVHSHMYWGKICLHQTLNQLLDTRGRRVFWEGPFKLCRTHFSRGAKTFQGGASPPFSYGSSLYPLADQSLDRLEKMFWKKYHVKATWTVLLQFKRLEQQKGRVNVNVCAAEENLKEELYNQISIQLSFQCKEVRSCVGYLFGTTGVREDILLRGGRKSLPWK